MRSSGFTLIEILVTLAISIFLSSIAITYSHVGQNDLNLALDATKIEQLIVTAKSLALSTYTGGGLAGACAYGVTFDIVNGKYSLFAYKPGGASCPSGGATKLAGLDPTQKNAWAQSYSYASWNVPLSPGIHFNTIAGGLKTVIFYPPRPMVLLSTDDATFVGGPLTLQIQTQGGTDTKTISVNSEGQVNY